MSALIPRDLNLGLQGEADRPIDAVEFRNPSVRNSALQVKFDAWLFPFMNIFATVGRVDGRATIPLSVLGSDLLPEQCDRPIAAPAVCDRELEGTAKPNYEGSNWSVGTTLAMGWQQFFVVLPIVYAVSDVNILDTDVDALNISPRAGINAELGPYGDLSFFVGATYLKAEVEVAGEKPSGAPPARLSSPSTLPIRPSPASTSRPMLRTSRATKSRASSPATSSTALASSLTHPPINPPHGAPSLSTSIKQVNSKPGVLPTHTSITQSLSSQSVTAISAAMLKLHYQPWRGYQNPPSQSGLVVNPFTITGSLRQAKNPTPAPSPTCSAVSLLQSKSSHQTRSPIKLSQTPVA